MEDSQKNNTEDLKLSSIDGDGQMGHQEVYDFFLQIPSPLVVLLGPQHRFALANPAYEKFVGRKVSGKTVLEAFTDTEVGEFVKLLDKVYQTGIPYLGHELPLTLPDENGVLTERIINVAYYPYRDANGSIKGILAVHQDITDHKNTQKRLMRAKEEAEKASQLKSAFLANMSHEIRTPLGVMMGFAELIVDPDTSPEERQQYGEILRKNGEHLSVIINDILDLSKVEAGEIHIEPTLFSMRDTVEEVFAELESKAKAKGLHLSVEFSEETDSLVKADKIRLKQIISNLVANSIKFTETGKIHLRFFKNDKNIQMEITDTGIGIESSEQEKLFKPFMQVDQSNTRKYGGTGLGLVLSKKLAKAMGGDLILKESVPGKGSIFLLTFPDTSTSFDIKQNHATKKREVVSPQSISLDNLEILLVEDSEDNQNLISHVLGQKGAHISIAKNGEEGIEKAINGDFNIVLMDLQMPVMDGYTATQILRDKGYDKPIIALTAHAMNGVHEKCINAGCTDHLVKPINFAELIKTVRHYAY